MATLVHFELVLPFFLVFSGNVLEQMLCPRLKILVRKDIISLGVAYFFETVHVELADKSGKVFMPEVGGQDLFS
jgi:hypothetical protein